MLRNYINVSFTYPNGDTVVCLVHLETLRTLNQHIFQVEKVQAEAIFRIDSVKRSACRQHVFRNFPSK